MGAIIDYIERTGKGKYQCFNTKKLCLDADDRDTIAYNYDDKAIAKATRPKTIIPKEFPFIIFSGVI